MPLPHLLVDYAGVIGLQQRETDLPEIADILDLSAIDLETAYWAHRAEYDRGLDDLQYWSRVASRPMTPSAVNRLVELDRASWTRLNHETIDILARHQLNGSRVTLLSNAPGFLARAVQALPELSFFDAMTFSCELGIAKPDPRSFKRTLAATGAKIVDTVFVDDRVENIEAANDLGIQGVLFVDAQDLDRSLELVSVT